MRASRLELISSIRSHGRKLIQFLKSAWSWPTIITLIIVGHGLVNFALEA